ncbi:MAG: oligosaccharide flippase family protein [Candidatus Roizmanbacteria bacterium]|nr:oligosaccharide flippase family protein [Candidatus Roizmanbacteria bacterium]
MIAKLSSFLKRPTSTAVIINTVGNYLNVFFSAFFIYLLVRIISRTEYGVFSVLLGITFVLANLLDFGTTATLYSYLPSLIEKKSENAYRLIKSTFFYQTLFSSIVIGFLLIIFPWLDLVFFKTKAPVMTLYLTGISVMFFIWQNFLINCLYVTKRVLQVNLYTLIANVAKTIIVIALALTHTISVGLIIFVFGIIGPIIFFALVYSSKKNHMDALMKAPIERSDFRMRYTLTYFIASQFFNLGLRMDLFLLSYFLSKDLGDYGAAQKIILTIITTIVSITQVISPAFAKVKSKKDLYMNVKPALLYMLIPTVIFLALFITPDWVFELFFTNKFYHTAAISRQLAIVYLPYSFISLFHLFLLYSVKRPGNILIGNVAIFIVVSVGCYLFIPTYGVSAAIGSLGVAFTIASLILIGFSYRAYVSLPNE